MAPRVHPQRNFSSVLTPEVWTETHHVKVHSAVTVATLHCMSLQLMWRHITLHRRHQNTSYSSHLSSAVTKQHDRIKGRGKRGARARTCVGRGERCVKIKGCKQSKKVCTTVLAQHPSKIQILFLPGLGRIHHVWERCDSGDRVRFFANLCC